MSYFSDFSKYSYHPNGIRPRTYNIGWCVGPRIYKIRWFDGKTEFRRQTAPEYILQTLWDFCKVSVVQMRGMHVCDLCDEKKPIIVQRNQERLLLGSAEIRVFSNLGDIYAAPNLIYHYVLIHEYKLPDKFVEALTEGVRPPSQEYYDRLEALQLRWNKTIMPHN